MSTRPGTERAQQEFRRPAKQWGSHHGAGEEVGSSRGLGEVPQQAGIQAAHVLGCQVHGPRSSRHQASSQAPKMAHGVLEPPLQSRPVLLQAQARWCQVLAASQGLPGMPHACLLWSCSAQGVLEQGPRSDGSASCARSHVGHATLDILLELGAGLAKRKAAAAAAAVERSCSAVL